MPPDHRERHTDARARVPIHEARKGEHEPGERREPVTRSPDAFRTLPSVTRVRRSGRVGVEEEIGALHHSATVSVIRATDVCEGVRSTSIRRRSDAKGEVDLAGRAERDT